MEIDGRKIGLETPPYIIAELSGNHSQSLEKAIKLVECAAEAGCDAIKLQTYTADSMTLNIDDKKFAIEDKNSIWSGEKLYNLYSRASTPWNWHEKIFSRAKSLGLCCFSSPFDDAAVDFLESLGVPAYKIASFECVDLPLIKRVAATGKPVIISTGMATLSEINDAHETAKTIGCSNLALLKCTSTYPAPIDEANLRTIGNMRDVFNCEVGLSDHTIGIGAAIAAVAQKATIIEKHLTISKSDCGIDSAFSMEPDEFKLLVTETRNAWKAMGTIFYGPSLHEKEAITRRRSIYITEDLNPGDILTRSNLRRIRPGHGLAPKYYETLLGKQVQRKIKKGTPVSWELLSLDKDKLD